MSTPAVYDLLGLGFGPANIAVAAALLEKQDPAFKNILFIERHSSFRWHPGMLLPDARMQISFMKDLATLRNPASPVTFLAYLHSQNRLLPFINRGSTIPTRKEFADYLLWASNYVQRDGISVNFGHEIVAISKLDPNTIQVQCRRLDDNELLTYHARNLIISPGGTPRIPPCLSLVLDHPQVLHSSQYALSIPAALERVVAYTGASRPITCAVLGSGQSAAEVTINIRERLCAIYPGLHQVDMIFRKGSMKPSDDSPFSNEIFDPASTDAHFFQTSQTSRDAIRREYRETNYGVVAPRTLDTLYEIIYDQRLNASVAQRSPSVGQPTIPVINLHPYTGILSADSTTDSEGQPGPFELTLQHIHSRAVTKKKYDIIVAATGYERSAWTSLLRSSDLAKHFFQGVPGPDISFVPVGASKRSGQASSIDTLSASDLTNALNDPSTSSSAPPVAVAVVDSDSVSDPESGSGPSTPMTESEAQFDSDLDTPAPSTLYISRKYRLLPLHGSEFTPKIYLQGVEETTHGLSDTLLSVLGVRSGEVVDDLCSA